MVCAQESELIDAARKHKEELRAILENRPVALVGIVYTEDEEPRPTAVRPR